MISTIDICFKNLMENPDVRKGCIAILLRCRPEEVRKTTLLPTTLRREYGNDKLGILDVLVLLVDGITDDDVCYRSISFCDERTGRKYTDLMNIQILELKKLPGKMQGEEDIISWMRFFGGKSREEFEDMAKANEYIGIAYEELQKLSADELKRLDYEAREKAVRDYNTQMKSALRRGLAQGARNKLREQTKKKLEKGMSVEEIADILEEDVGTIRELAVEIAKQ